MKNLEPLLALLRRHRLKSLAALTLLVVLAGALLLAGGNSAPAAKPEAKPALTVTAIKPLQLDWPQTLSATGNVAAWQEAIIGSEISNFRIVEIRAHVGDRVRKGDVLARIDATTIGAELAEARASVAELEAALAEARANAERARQLRDRGFYSPQQSTQSITAEQTATARLNAGRARLQAAQQRMARTTVTAPDDGIVSARNATVGSLAQSGQELFRLIRDGRLEWRAEVTAAELAALKPGLPAMLTAPGGNPITGTVRALAPTVDPQTRNALIYVDLPPTSAQILGAGMFARGEIDLGRRPAMTLPQSAVILREGFAYVFRIESEAGAIGKVALTKVSTGRRIGDRVEIGSIDPNTRVVASGTGFLADGDNVRIVADAAVKAAQ